MMPPCVWRSWPTFTATFLRSKRETVELLMRLDWPTIRGNHDRWMTDWPLEKHYASDAFAFRALNSAQLGCLATGYANQRRETGILVGT
jgi:hypothetical protein